MEVEAKQEDLSVKSPSTILPSTKHENVPSPVSQSEAESLNKSSMTTPHVQNG